MSRADLGIGALHAAFRYDLVGTPHDLFKEVFKIVNKGKECVSVCSVNEI